MGAILIYTISSPVLRGAPFRSLLPVNTQVRHRPSDRV